MIDILGIKYITEKEASLRYGYSTSWFQQKRSQNLPPPFVKLKGKVLYSLDKLDKWFIKNMIEVE